MKIVLCDDDIKTVEHFLSMLKSFLSENSTYYEIDVYEDASKLISDINNHVKKYDIYFIDIEMPVPGENVVKSIRRIYPDALCTFLSDYPQHGFVACRINVNSYIYKDMKQEEVNPELERLTEICHRRKLTFCFKTSDGNDVTVKVCNIEYIESIKRRVVVHLVDNTRLELEVSGYSLTSLNIMYEFEEFLRISRSYLLNYDCIKQLRPNKVTMMSGNTIKINKEQFQKIFDKAIES
ncbi:MAG: LytTR family transcriptional regulator DNA-binding domain-containing protein [Ruminococcus sp.]|nr:LytTR family transcriptional regulator DNA-binding domain-containing protein [Ruminococcus sp.]